MKIVYILPVNMTKYGYDKDQFLNSHFTVEAARAMASRGYKVTLFVFWNTDIHYQESSFDVYFKKTSFNSFFNHSFAEISIELLKKKFSSDTLIYFHEPNRLFFVLFCLNRNSRIVTDHHGTGIGNPFTFSSKFYWIYGVIRRLFLRYFLNKVDMIFVHNKEAATNLKMYVKDKSKVVITPQGIDTDKYKDFDRDQLRKKFNINDKINIIFAGRIHPEKGITELIEAYRQLKKKHKNINLTLIGPLHFKSLLDVVKPYWIGFKKSEELQQWFTASDIFCLPTYRESFGIVLIEALYYNLPIVTTTVAGPLEAVPKANALFVPPKNTKALYKALEKLLDKKLRREKSVGGRDIVLTKYSISKITNQYEHLIKKS